VEMRQTKNKAFLEQLWVCWSMISESQIGYGFVVLRQKSLLFCKYHFISKLENFIIKYLFKK
jgi:hypothetical protein